MNPLQRLYKTELALLATVSTAAGVALLFLAHWLDTQAGWGWLKNFPLRDMGLLLFGTGLFGVVYQYVGQRDSEENFRRELRQVLRDAAPDFRDAVVDGFAFKPDTLTKVASPETLDRVIENSLGIRLSDAALARDMYTDLRQQVVQAPERREGVSVNVALAPWEHGPASGNGAMFVATVRWEYRVVPSSPTLRFNCVSDLDEYDELRRDPSYAAMWYFQPKCRLNGASEEVFQVVDVAVDGKPRPVRRAARSQSQVYTASIEEETMRAGRQVTVAFTYRVLVQRHGHLLHLDISRPTKDLRVQFQYGGCGIRYVNVLDYIASSSQPRVSRLPASGPTPSVEIAFDGWVMPKAGVAFVWVLEDEINTAARHGGDTPRS